MNYLLIVLLALPLSVLNQQAVKICVPRKLDEACRQMEGDLPDKFSCVIARDWVDCARKLQSGQADLANMDPRGIYIAGKYFDVVPIATEVIDEGPFQYEGVALVSKNSDIRTLQDLAGRRSCHAAFGGIAGWHVPLSQLMARGILQSETCAEGSQESIEFLKIFKDFFSGGSCAPGSWSTDPLVDAELKSLYPELCSQCHDPQTCSLTDRYAGSAGAIRCLLSGSGDVAFTKISKVKEFLNNDPTIAERVELLCLDGGRVKLTTDSKGLNSCHWGNIPNNAFVTSSDNYREDVERLQRVITETQALYTPVGDQTPDWYHKAFLSSPYVNAVQLLDPNKNNYRSYLGDFIYAIERAPCNSTGIPKATWCVMSEQEKQKCEDYAKAASSRNLWPEIDCVISTSESACIALVASEDANLAVLDAYYVYHGGRYSNLQPVSVEVYGKSDVTHYAVAVLPSASNVTKLSQLRGLRSCHTEIGTTVGWVIPIAALIQGGSLDPIQCNRAAEIAEFFSSGSCVPGANSSKYNPGHSHVDKLCQQCIGDQNGNFKCAEGSKERYYGFTGAFRCLAEGKGDVAFMKHTTVPQYTDGHSTNEWAKDLLSSDFKLLCSQGGTKPVQEYADCNLAKVPSDYVMTTSNATPEDRLQYAKLLASSAQFFGDDSKVFRLFDRYGPRNEQKNLLFNDRTTYLKSISTHSTYIDALSEAFHYAAFIQELDETFSSTTAVTDPKVCNRKC